MADGPDIEPDGPDARKISGPQTEPARSCEWCERDCPRCGYPIDAGWRHVDVPQAPGAGIVMCRAERAIGPLVEVLSGYLTHRRDLLRAIEERNPPVINRRLRDGLTGSAESGESA